MLGIIFSSWILIFPDQIFMQILKIALRITDGGHFTKDIWAYLTKVKKLDAGAETGGLAGVRPPPTVGPPNIFQ